VKSYLLQTSRNTKESQTNNKQRHRAESRGDLHTFPRVQKTAESIFFKYATDYMHY